MFRTFGLAAEFRNFVLLLCELVLEEDLRILPDLVESVRTKDAGALAATRALGLANRVSADRDFERVPEHRTPREFLVGLGEKPRAGEE